MLDTDLARLYGVSAKRLNEAVRRNRDRFPDDFIFQLSREEFGDLTRQIEGSNLRSQFATSSWGGRRYRPYAFTEQGVAMLSSVLRSKRAIRVNVEIMRAFVRLRRMLASNEELARKLAALEKKYDVGWPVNRLSNIIARDLLRPVKEGTVWLGGWSRKIRQTMVWSNCFRH